jgi:hypothetical protein
MAQVLCDKTEVYDGEFVPVRLLVSGVLYGIPIGWRDQVTGVLRALALLEFSV